MTSQRVRWDGYLSVLLPPGWDFSEESGVIAIFDPDGVGATQMSFARARPPATPNAHDLAKRFAASHGFGTVDPTAVLVGGLEAAVFEAIERRTRNYWRVWHACGRGRVATITYTCQDEDRDVERAAVDELVQGIEWLW